MVSILGGRWYGVGVPQGTSTFLIFINDLDCNIANTTCILKFADDTKLISTVNNHDDSTVLQQDL